MRYLLLLLCIPGLLAASIGNIAALKGSVEIKRHNATLRAAYGTAIEEKDQIVTRAHSRVQIILKDRTVVTIGANSQYRFDTYRFNAAESRTEMHLDRGFFRIITGKLGKVAPKRFKVHTKSATIGIRGTHFFGLVQGKNENIGCIRGSISVLTGGRRFTIPSGRMLSLRGRKATVVPISQNYQSTQENESAGGDSTQSSEESGSTAEGSSPSSQGTVSPASTVSSPAFSPSSATQTLQSVVAQESKAPEPTPEPPHPPVPPQPIPPHPPTGSGGAGG